MAAAGSVFPFSVVFVGFILDKDILINVEILVNVPPRTPRLLGPDSASQQIRERLQKALMHQLKDQG